MGKASMAPKYFGSKRLKYYVGMLADLDPP
jgi:hypothetical protein